MMRRLVLAVLSCVAACGQTRFTVSGSGDSGGLDAGQADASKTDARSTDARRTDATESGADAGGPCTVGGKPRTVAANQAQPTDVIVDSENMYWTNVSGSTCDGGACGSIARAPKAGGGTVATIASGIPKLSGFATDDANVYWSENNSIGAWAFIVSLPKIGGSWIHLSDYGQGCCFERLVVDGTNVYWTATINAGVVETVLKTARDDTSPSVLASSSKATPYAIAIDNSTVYFGEATSGELISVSKNGGAVSALASQQGTITAIAVDDTNVYWTTNAGDVLALAKTTDGGAPTTLASNQASPWGLAVDSCVYWTNAGSGRGADGSLAAVPTSGGVPVTLATGLASPAGIAVDDKGIYWAEAASGRVMVIPR